MISTIREDRSAIVTLAWTPGIAHMVVPEEVPGAEEAVLTARKIRNQDDLAHALDKIRRFSLILGALCVYMLWQGWVHAPRIATAAERLIFSLRAVQNSMSVGICLLMFLIFAFIPWYQSRKHLRMLEHWDAEDLEALVPIMRFETWMEMQKAPITRFLMGLICLVGLAQLMPGKPGGSIAAAGLVKQAYLENGEWWRLLTAPFLHGNPLHFLLNAAALLYLGKRVEVFARWPHVPLVFLFAACVGGEASARFLSTASVGASGGLMGWLGFLLVFEFLHSRLVPQAATRRLLAGVAATALIGVVGYKFIDNAAHLGGLLAGIVYAGIVFPRSSSPNRPGATVTDRIAGIAAIGVLAASAGFAAWKILS